MLTYLYSITIFKILCIILCGIFWRLSGRPNSANWFRWAGVPLIILLANHQSMWSLLSVALLMGAINIPYGDESWLRKTFNGTYTVRYICGWAYILSLIFFAFGSIVFC